MKTGIDFREGISGTGGTQSWVQNVQGEKFHEEIQRTCRPKMPLTGNPNWNHNVQEEKFHEEIQRTCRPKMPSTGNPNWNHNAIGLRADSGT